MTPLAILKAAIEIVNWLSKYFHDKQLIDTGTYKAIAEGNENALKKITLALAATPISLQDDPNNRDNH